MRGLLDKNTTDADLYGIDESDMGYLKQLGYYNKMNIHELKKMIRKYVGKFVKNLEGFNEQFYPTINDVSVFI